jgi:hypothetical protein
MSAPRPQWRADWARPEDEPALLELFAKAFGHEMPAAQWRWKYAGLESAGTVVRRGRSLVAFYGGIPRRISFCGEPATAVQISDVMVEPAERGVLTRKGPLFLATSLFLDRCIGPGKPYRFGFGFPNERHMKVAERLRLYAPADELWIASWPALPGRPALAWRARALPRADARMVDVLWPRMAEAAREVAIGVRDGAYLRHRYFDHPTVRYTTLVVTRRFQRTPLGLVILRDRGAEGVELIDVVGAPGAMRALVGAARRAAGRLERARLFAWMTPSAARWFAGSAPEVTRTGFIVPASALDAPEHALSVRGRWWLLGGDSDTR